MCLVLYDDVFSLFVGYVWLFVPSQPFAVKQLGCALGIVVTASHNPKEDNGYKVYWGNGAQIIPPHDHGIAVRK